MASIEQTFAERLKAERKAQKLSQNALAEKARTSQCVISHIENEQTIGLLHTAIALADVLGVSIDWLIGRTDNKERGKIGAWEYLFFNSYCSECGWENKANSATRTRTDYPYCPHCGAKMDGNKAEK